MSRGAGQALASSSSRAGGGTAVRLFLVLLALAQGGCKAPREASMTTPVELGEQVIGDLGVYPMLVATARSYEVRLTLTRPIQPAEHSLLNSEDFEVELRGQGGKPLPLLRRPEGPVHETQGPGISANLEFEFERKVEPRQLAELRVSYRGQPVRFAIPRLE